MEAIAEATVAVAQSQLVISFLLNFLLSGVMSFLWNIFNTMQIITSLPLLKVKLPANVDQLHKIVLGIANFEVIDKKTIYKDYAVKLLGLNDPDLQMAKDQENEELDKDKKDESGLEKAF